METRVYKFKGKKGISDLLPEYAFFGASQGIGTSNSVEDYETSGGWLIPLFRDIAHNQEAIDKRIAENKQHNANYIESLKAIDKFGEEYEIALELIDNPLFDNIDIVNPIESCKMVFLDFDNDNSINK